MEKLHKEILGLMGKIIINCWQERDIIVFELEGQLDIYNSGDLNNLIDAYIQRGFHKFVMNLEKLTYLDSAAISVFIVSHQKLGKISGVLYLASLNAAPKEVFKMAKLHDVFQIFPDTSEAIKNIGP